MTKVGVMATRSTRSRRARRLHRPTEVTRSQANKASDIRVPRHARQQTAAASMRRLANGVDAIVPAFPKRNLGERLFPSTVTLRTHPHHHRPHRGLPLEMMVITRSLQRHHRWHHSHQTATERAPATPSPNFRVARLRRPLSAMRLERAASPCDLSRQLLRVCEAASQASVNLGLAVGPITMISGTGVASNKGA